MSLLCSMSWNVRLRAAPARSAALRSTQKSLPSGSASHTQPVPSGLRWSSTTVAPSPTSAVHLGVAGAVAGLDVEVHAVLDRARFGHRDEQHRRAGAGGRVRLGHEHLRIVVGVDVPAEHGAPEAASARASEQSRVMLRKELAMPGRVGRRLRRRDAPAVRRCARCGSRRSSRAPHTPARPRPATARARPAGRAGIPGRCRSRAWSARPARPRTRRPRP